MKTLKVFLLFALISVATMAQTPQGFNYQAVVRDAEGQPVAEQSVGVRITLQNEDASVTHYAESHVVNSSPQGVITLNVGEGTTISGEFSAVPWSIGEIYMKVEVDPLGGENYVEMGTMQFQAVPYALFAADGNQGPQGDPGADGVSIQWLGTFSVAPETPALNQAYYNSVDGKSYIYDGSEWQLLSQDGADGENGILVSGTAGQSLTHTGDEWVATSNIYTNSGDSVGIGTTIPEEKLHVEGNIKASGALIGQTIQVGEPVEDPDAPLFVVRNSENKIVFAVYESGVRMYVDSDMAKVGSKGGFAVGGLTQSKANHEYFRVTPDSVRIYIDTASIAGKSGSKGGFAVGGLTQSKGTPVDLLRVTADSTRIYIDTNQAKTGSKGGFAVGGLTQSKGVKEDYLRVTRDSTRVYVNNMAKSGSKGGFAVGGLTQSKSSSSFMYLTPENYFIGHESGKQVDGGLYNATLGYESGMLLTSGSSNSFIGFQSGYNTISGSGNLFVGFQSGFSNKSGNYNTFMGYMAGYSNTTGKFNTFMGSYTGYLNKTGENNTFVGDSAGYKNTGNSNSFFGTKTGLNNTLGIENVFVGNMCGYNNTTGTSNVLIGNKAGYSYSTSYNVLIGNKAGFSNKGSSNVYIGFEAGRDNSTGSSNVYIGRKSGQVNTNGSQNVFIGDYSGYTNSGGEGNVFIGKDAGYANTSGNNNIYIGYNVANACSSGWLNISIGAQSGINSNGTANIMLGTKAGYSDSDGMRNLYLGTSAGYSNVHGFKNVFIGNEAGYFSKSSEKLYIENSDADSLSALIYGDFVEDFVRINHSLGISRMPASNSLEVNGTASKTTAGEWLANSDRRIKTDIQDINNASELILKLRPVKFKYTNYWKSKHPTIEDKYYYNFIAQEFRIVFPESVKGSGEFIEGDSEEILQLDSYNAQIISIKAVQELIQENRKQQAEIESLKSELAAIKALLTK